MSKFSEKCKELLAANGSNVYRLSQSASLERTSLQRMVTGKRLPNQEFVTSFCRALRIPLSEENELMELYKMECMGETAYKNQKTILQLFKHLADLEKTDYQTTCSIADQGNLILLSNIANQSYDTELLLQYVLKNAFHDEESTTVYTNLPGTCTLLSHYLHLLAPQYTKRLVLKQLIHFHISDSSTYENLETLNQILPLYFSNKIDYEPYYYYSTLSTSEQSSLLFPYYIITSNYVLQLSGDLQKGMLHSEPDIIQQYTNELLDKLSHATLLINHTDSLREANHLYTSLNTYSQINSLYSLGGLCQTELLSPADFTELAIKYAGEYMDLFDEYMGFVKLLCNSNQHIFTPYNSVKNFCTDGQCSGTLSVLFPPFDSEMRLRGLKYFFDNLESSNISILSENFIFPNSIVIELYDHQLLHIIHVSRNKEISFISIRESSICEAFEEFFRSLNNSEYYCEKDDQKKSLLKMIHSLERNVKNRITPPQHTSVIKNIVRFIPDNIFFILYSEIYPLQTPSAPT